MTLLARRLYTHPNRKSELWTLQSIMGSYLLVREREGEDRWTTSAPSLDAAMTNLADETEALALFGYRLAESEDHSETVRPDWIPAGGRHGQVPAFL